MAAVRLCGSSRTGGALGNTTRYDGARGMSMTLNIDAVRCEVRALDNARGSSAEAATVPADGAQAPRHLAYDSLALEPDGFGSYHSWRRDCVSPPSPTQRERDSTG